MREITRLLRAAAAGDTASRDRAVVLIYEDLHERARALLAGERADHTLSPRDLLHEVYLRLFEDERIEWQDRNHFFGIAVRRMRQILINHAKHHSVRMRFLERLGDELAREGRPSGDSGVDAEALEGALERLDGRGGKYEQLARVVDMRFFGGMSHEEIAGLLCASTKTVQRDLKAALMVLLRDLSGGLHGRDDAA
jgi:RNA polymerase sigma factor (TIGR02999 family)